MLQICPHKKCDSERFELFVDDEYGYHIYKCENDHITTTLEDKPVMSRGILLSPLLVKEVMAGRKDITRRVVRPQPVSDVHSIKMCLVEPEKGEFRDLMGEDVQEVYRRKCRHGKPGDLLYVRETWSFIEKTGEYVFKSDWKEDTTVVEPKWRTSIYMPKAIAKLWLKIVDVKCEKIRDITDEEICREGLKSRREFIHVWNKLNVGRGYGWLDNPWVWAITFKPLELKRAYFCHDGLVRHCANVDQDSGMCLCKQRTPAEAPFHCGTFKNGECKGMG